MALTKTSNVVANNTTMTAAAGNVTSSDVDLTSVYSATCRVRITNGGTLGVAAQVSVQVSEDTTSGNYTQIALVKSGDLVSGTVAEYTIAIPDTSLHMRFVSGSNTTNNCTLRIVVDEITAV